MYISVLFDSAHENSSLKVLQLMDFHEQVLSRDQRSLPTTLVLFDRSSLRAVKMIHVILKARIVPSVQVA